MGKTSLVTTLVSQDFPSTVPTYIRPIVVPKDLTLEHVELVIVDTDDSEEEIRRTKEEIQHANVVVVVVSAESRQCVDRAQNYWIPFVRKISKKVPFVITFSKVDLKPEDLDLEMVEADLMKDLSIEYCISCSSKLLLNVQNPFYSAQKAVFFPSIPLLNDDKTVIFCNFRYSFKFNRD